MHRPKQSDIVKAIGLLGIDAIKSESLLSDRYVVVQTSAKRRSVRPAADPGWPS